MPIYQLSETVVFPPVRLADKSGILAVGGDLSSDRLLAAYRQGIFPWYSENEPILWWSPDPRFVLFLEELRISRSMNKVLRRGVFKITYDNDFYSVIASCRHIKRKQEGTWITDDMLTAYGDLHAMGFAHSAEAWHEGMLVGGIYGVSLGRCFFGESMFSAMHNASKAALMHLANRLKAQHFEILDCQVYTAHMETLGARHIPRKEFTTLLRRALSHETIQGNWGHEHAFSV